jgi:HPt (histidine-containing phosphotransfer) domain-containing protein
LNENSARGIDIAKALSRFGDGEACLNSLKSFAAHTPDLLKELRYEKNLETYGIIVHGIKGSSYGIAAEELGQRAEELEKQAKSGNQDFVFSHTEDFLKYAENIIGGLKNFLDTYEARRPRPKKPAPDPELLARIREASKQYDMTELDKAMEELEQYNYETRGDIVPWLREHVDLSDLGEIDKRLSSEI